MAVQSTQSLNWVKTMSKTFLLVMLTFMLMACGATDLYQGQGVKVEALSQRNAQTIDDMREELRTTKDRFMALESLYVDVAQTLKKQSGMVEGIEGSLAKFQLNPASAQAVDEIKGQLSGIQRNLRVLQSRVAKVEMLSGKSSSKANSAPSKDEVKEEATNKGLGDGSEFAAHIVSFREAAQVKPGWEALKEKYPGQFDGLRAVTDSIETAGLGKFIRLLVGPFKNQTDAQSLCDQIKAKGEFCQVASFKGTEVN